MPNRFPSFTAAAAAALAREHYGLIASPAPLPGERDQNMRLDTADGQIFVLKIAQAGESRGLIECQNQVLTRLHDAATRFRFPRVIPSLDGADIVTVTVASGEHHVRMVEYLPGKPLATVKPHSPALLRDVGALLGTVDRVLQGYAHPAACRALQWDIFTAATVVNGSLHMLDPAARVTVERVLRQSERPQHVFATLRKSVIHNDGNDYNLIVRAPSRAEPHAPAQIVGLIDFGDLLHSWTIAEVAVAAAYAMLGKADPLTAAAHVVEGYYGESAIPDAELAAIFPLSCTRIALIVTLAAVQRRQWPDNEYLSISEAPARALLDRLHGVDADHAHFRFRAACALEPCPAAPRVVAARKDDRALLAERRKRIGPSLSIAYDRPLTIVRGWMQHLYDADGQPYLDAVNNVAHVGHSHPRVVAALKRQATVLNTNTRYLHPNLVHYAERLAATLPEPLSICYFVCSGSEANELALRLARAYTAAHDVIVIDGAYHGNTSSLIELSPYKFNGPGGAGRSPHVQVVPLPDAYRGRYRSLDADTGSRYAQHVSQAIAAVHERGARVAAFFAEPLPGCGGQIVLPAGYLSAAFAHVHAAGGVCIADEVQTGLGRVGSHFWAFETQGVIPDIVTVGKPIGNGHPLGAVITTPGIAAAFDNGMEYFNTFGGNPVSCAVGMAVLDVIADEGLQQNALQTGALLLEQLRELRQRHDIVGDVRGRGLYIGIELVLDRGLRTPAGARAGYVANRLRERGILLSTDGPDHNVLKIKPPLVFNEADAGRLVATLDDVLGEDALRAAVES